MMPRTFATFLIALFVVTGLAACSRGGKGDDDDAPKDAASAPRAPAASEPKNPLALTAQEQQAAGIQVQSVSPTQVTDSVVLNGTLVPNQERIASVVPRMPGRIVSAPVPVGAHVKAGERLAVIESIEVGEAQAAYVQAKSEATVTEAALARAQRLAADEIIAQKDLQRARADAERAHASLRAAIVKLRIFGVGPASPESHAEALYPVLAPLTGTLTEKHAVVGTHAGSEPLFTVADLSTVWLEADVYEKDLAAVKPGIVASVTVAAYGGRPFAGRLTYIAPTMDAASRTVKARIEVPNRDGALKPGMFATARIPSTSTASRLVLPGAAVTLLNDRTTVFVLTPQGFQPRAVEGQQRPDGTFEVKGGLQPGEKVATAGAYALKSRALKSSLAKDND